mmetsp:Transcript_29070/g.84083  ORF Transcript_29070/g.84083 Transcript_29070/m.84083 type:complete len:106 (+) Transcript_29070:1415-1732(+)
MAPPPTHHPTVHLTHTQARMQMRTKRNTQTARAKQTVPFTRPYTHTHTHTPLATPPITPPPLLARQTTTQQPADRVHASLSVHPSIHAASLSPPIRWLVEKVPRR